MSLVVTDLRKRYGKLHVLTGVSFHCDGGEVCAVTGENGSGKSTILAILAGLIPASAGAAELSGEALIGRRPAARARIGFVPEKANPPGRMNGRQLFALVASLKGAQPPSPEERATLGLDHLLRRPIGGLSLGQRRRLCLAAALIGAPDLLLLDEPTNGLDADGADVLIEALRRAAGRGVAVVVATHDRALIERTRARELNVKGGVVTPPLNRVNRVNRVADAVDSTTRRGDE